MCATGPSVPGLCNGCAYSTPAVALLFESVSRYFVTGDEWGVHACASMLEEMHARRLLMHARCTWHKAEAVGPQEGVGTYAFRRP